MLIRHLALSPDNHNRLIAAGDKGTRGGIKGSFPVDGDYGRFEYLNWACKFFIDANLLEKEVRRNDGI